MTVQKTTEVVGLDKVNEAINRIINRAINSLINETMTVQKRADIIEDIKILSGIGIAAVFEQQPSQSPSEYLDNSASKKLHVNADGTYILPKVTSEEQMQRNQALIALLDEWVEEGDAEEQRETYECLKQISRVSI